MLKKALITVFMLMFGIVDGLLLAQHNFFSHLNKENSGLSYDSVREIFQDSRGFVWIGTYKGLSRYDGVRFKNYDRDDFGVTSDFINVIREDVDGNLWIGTDNGVVVYNPENDAFSSLEKFLNNDTQAPDDRIFAIERNSKGVMWISSRDKGLYSYTPQTKILKSHPMYDESGRACCNIYRMTIDRNDGMYLSIYCDDIYYTDSLATSFNPLDIGKDTGIFKGDDVEGMVLSGKFNDILYVASKRNGLVEVDFKNLCCRSLYRLAKDVRPTNLILDSNKNIWLSTTNGLVCYDLYSGESVTYHSDPRDRFSVSDSYITKVFKDDKSRLWVGTQYGGLNYYSPSHDVFRKFCKLSDGTSLEGAIVRSIVEDSQKNLWIATERKGLLKYSGGVLTSVGGNLPQSIFALADDQTCLWLGSQKGIFRMNYSTGKIRHYSPFDNNERDNRVVSIFRSQMHGIYVGTTVGVMKYNRETDNFEIVEGLKGVTVEHMAEDSRGFLWLASYSAGVYKYDISKRIVTGHYSPQSGSDNIPDMISSICVDSSDNVWIIGFSSGFFKYVRNSDTFEAYSTKTLKSLPTDVYFMALPDDFGNLWISSDSGILEFDPFKKTSRVFSLSDGLRDKEYTKSGIVLRNGNLAMGAANGFVIFNPRDFRASDALSAVTITDMYLDYEPIDKVARRDIFTGNIDLQEKLTLRFADNSFGFSFALLGSSYPASDKVFCILEGYDTQWRDISVLKSVHWNNVPAGEYTLRLSNGEFSGNFVDAHSPVTIKVKPKFWASSLGILLIILIVGSFAAMGVQIFIKSQRARERRRIEEYRQQKDKELLHEKMTFFSNIIHEIKTPLTLIRTPLHKIMASGKCDNAIKDEIEVISSSTDYMNDLVRELLEYVRLEEHGYVLDLKNVDVVERAGFLCYSFRDTAKSKNVKMQFTHDFANLTMAVDTIAFRKIMNNMLDNAVKYAETYIDIHMSMTESELIISFRNDGDIIPHSRRESIFKPFVQFSADKSPYSQSFGIGLSYARNLVELHGGTLTLSDRDDCTEFVLKLPVKLVPQVADKNDTDKELAKRSDLPLVLIVEDNASLLTYLKKNLKHEYNVLTSQSAENAMTLLLSYKVDIILTDIALRGMSGVELCKMVNSDPELSHIPVIVVSAISSLETKMKCMEYGVSNYIEKPYSMDYLLVCIKGALEKRAMLRDTYRGAPAVISNINIINRDDDFLKRLQNIVMENLSNPGFSNKQLEEMLYMGHSTLNRKMKALLNTTPNDYIRTKRLAAAADMLVSSGYRVNEVSYAVGFNSPSYFAKCFKKAYGMLPAEYVKVKSGKTDQ